MHLRHRPVLLPQVSKNDDEEHCFLKLFGFIKKLKISIELAFWQTVVCKYARAQVRRSRLKLPQEQKIARLFKCMLASENKFCNLEMRLPASQGASMYYVRMILDFFLTHINTVLNICQTGHCLDPLTQLFCGRDIWMVPKVK